MNFQSSYLYIKTHTEQLYNKIIDCQLKANKQCLMFNFLNQNLTNKIE